MPLSIVEVQKTIHKLHVFTTTAASHYHNINCRMHSDHLERTLIEMNTRKGAGDTG